MLNVRRLDSVSVVLLICSVLVNFFERFYEQRLVRENEFLPKTIQIRRATNVNNIGVVEINTTQLENLLANQHRTKQVIWYPNKFPYLSITIIIQRRQSATITLIHNPRS